MQNATEEADKATRNRAIFAPFAGVAMLSVQQWLFFTSDWEDIESWRLGLWVILAILALLFLMSGGLWFKPREVRRLANDEATEHNRQAAIAAGFLAAVVTALIVFLVSPFEPVSAQRAAHIILSLGLGVALVAFGLRESRTLG